jgi:general secretion pathway protein G
MKRHPSLYVPLMVLASVLATGCSAPKDREATLKQDLRMMRDAIDRFTLDKQQAPQSLQDLVDGHYLKEIPTDPFTGKKDWVPQFGSVVLSPTQTSAGMVDVRSNSTQVAGPYKE